MIRRQARLMLTALALAALAPAGIAAQTIEIGDIRIDAWGHPVLRIGQNFELKQGDAAHDVVVIGGDATIDGKVDRDVVVILGKAKVGATAQIDGSLVIVGGTADVAQDAKVREDFFVLGGYEGSPAFHPGGQWVAIGTQTLGLYMRNIVPWLTRGLLWGRLIVPGLGWVWTIAGLFFLVNLLLNVALDVPVRHSTAAMRATPVSAFFTGLLVLLLIGPVCVLLAVSVVGIAVIPVLMCAAFFATVIGKIGFARWIGMSVVHQENPEDRVASFRSFLIGSIVMLLLYMTPMLGLITWTLAGILGLGSATLAFMTAYRRENPKKPRAPKVAAPSVQTPPPVDEPPPAPAVAAVAVEVPPATFQDTPLPEVPRATSFAFPRAEFVERLAAFTLDLILILIVANVFDFDRYHEWPLGRVGILFAIAYHVAFWTWKGTTLGGIICNLRVVRADGRPPEFSEALVRGLTGIFSLAVLGLGFVWMLKDPDRQTWHDRVAGTYVIKVPRTYPI